jgi:hypothetical protein
MTGSDCSWQSKTGRCNRSRSDDPKAVRRGPSYVTSRCDSVRVSRAGSRNVGQPAREPTRQAQVPDGVLACCVVSADAPAPAARRSWGGFDTAARIGAGLSARSLGYPLTRQPGGADASPHLGHFLTFETYPGNGLDPSNTGGLVDAGGIPSRKFGRPKPGSSA